jgi:hypothetical protein
MIFFQVFLSIKSSFNSKTVLAHSISISLSLEANSSNEFPDHVHTAFVLDVVRGQGACVLKGLSSENQLNELSFQAVDIPNLIFEINDFGMGFI